MSTTNALLSKSYTEFLEYTLLPVETPPTDANCGICRLHFVESKEILAAVLAAATETEVVHDIAVRVRNCGHLFHKDCLCGWITGDVVAAPNLRSCPLCKTELVRYGICARAEHLLLEIRKAGYDVNALGRRYDIAYEPFERLEELEKDVAGVMEDFRNETNNQSQPTRDSLFTQLHNVLNKNRIWGRDLTYLGQLLLDGHSIAESIRIWYTYLLDTAQEDFITQSKILGKELDPLLDRLYELEYALEDLLIEVHKAEGFLDLEFALEMQEVFGPTTLTASVLEEPQEGKCYEDETGLKIEDAGSQVGWLRSAIGWIQSQISKLEGDGRVEREEDTDDVDTANMDEQEVDHDRMDVEDSMDSEYLYSDYMDTNAMDVDGPDSP